jgi:hypothetical protein
MHSLKNAKQRKNAISKVFDHKCNGKYNTLEAECVNNELFYAWLKENRIANPGHWQKIC